METNKPYDVIVVGGGIGGAGVAALLACKKKRVLLIEPIKRIGGRCSSYEKDGFMTPTYVHAFARVDRGPCEELAKAIGTSIRWGRENIAYFYLEDREIKVRVNGNLSNANLARQAGIPISELVRMGSKIALEWLFKKAQFDKDKNELDIRSWLLKYTQNPNIHALTACISMGSFCVPYWESSMLEFIEIVKGIRKAGACGYPMEECGSIPGAYMERFYKFGGEFRQGRVKRILVEDGQAKGVEMKDGEIIEAPMVISNIGVKPTVLDLVGEEHFDAKYIDSVKKMSHSWSAIVVKAALDRKVTTMKACMCMPTLDPVAYYQKLERGELPDEMNMWVTAPSNLSPDLVPQGKQLLCAGAPVPFRPGVDWKPWVERCFETVERRFPEMKGHILWKDAVTPDQIDKWVGKEGAVIGLAQKIGQVGKDRPSIQSPIGGLLFVGSDVGQQEVGVELAAKSAMQCAETVESYCRNY